jgi:hypothetical protein
MKEPLRSQEDRNSRGAIQGAREAKGKLLEKEVRDGEGTSEASGAKFL